MDGASGPCTALGGTLLGWHATMSSRMERRERERESARAWVGVGERARGAKWSCEGDLERNSAEGPRALLFEYYV